MQSSTSWRRLGFSMAAAIRSLSLICLLTKVDEEERWGGTVRRVGGRGKLFYYIDRLNQVSATLHRLGGRTADYSYRQRQLTSAAHIYYILARKRIIQIADNQCGGDDGAHWRMVMVWWCAFCAARCVCKRMCDGREDLLSSSVECVPFLM